MHNQHVQHFLLRSLRVLARLLVVFGFLYLLFSPHSQKVALAAPGDPLSVNCSVGANPIDGWDVTVNWEFEPYTTPPSYTNTPYMAAVVGGGPGGFWMSGVGPSGSASMTLGSSKGGHFDASISNAEAEGLESGCDPAPISCSLSGGPIVPGGSVTANANGLPGGYGYYFSAPGGNMTTTGNSSVSIQYNSPGQYSVDVQSIDQSAHCGDVTVQSQTPTVSIGVSPSSVQYGNTTNISWSSQNATSCTATSGAGFSTGGGTSGSDGSDPLTADESFTVTCTGPGGTASDSASVTVTLPPLSCSITDSVIVVGGSIDASASGGLGSYSWSTPGAHTWGNGANIGIQYESVGDFSVDVSTPQTGQSAHCGDVHVNPAGPYADLWVSGANPVNYNSPAMLQWEGGGGDINSCTATQGPGFSTGGAVYGTDQTGQLTTTTQFTIVCTGPTSNESDSVTVYVNGAAPACTSVYPQAAFTSATSGTFYAYAEGVTGASQVLFQTWGDTGGQDDLVSYQGVNLGGGKWRASINLGAHKAGNPEYGNINVHVYARSGSYPTVPDGWCGAANFTRTASTVPDVTLGVSPASGTYPQVARLTWTTTNTPTSCVASSSTNDWTGAKGVAITNSETLVPTVGPHTYTIVCSNASGTDSDTVSYTQNACTGCTPSGTITTTPASPCSITPPATSCSPIPQVSWSTTNVTNAQLMVSKKDPNTGVFGPYTLFNSGCSPNNPSGLPRSITSSGSTVDEYIFKLYSAPDCFTFPGGGLTGTVILLWDDAYGAIPSGWTCISCAVSDPFYGRMPRLTDTYGGVGGADTHTHTLTYVSQTDGASRSVGESGFGGFRPQNNHQHTWNPVTTDAAWNLPPYKHLKFITRTNPPIIPANAIALFDSAVPSGWTRYSTMDGLYLRGGPDSNPWGAASHTNTFNADSATVSGSMQDTANNVSVADGHRHSIVGASLSAAANTPPYIDLIFGRITADGAAPAGMMAFFNAAPPAGWTTVSGSGSPYYQRLVRGSAAFGGTGGSATHNHGGSVTATTGVPSANDRVKSGFSNIGSESTHTHAVTFSVSTENSMPYYRDVILAKYSSFTLLDTETLTGALPAPHVDLGLSNKDVISINGDVLTNNPKDGIAEADIGTRTIPEGAPVGFAINVVNSGNAGFDPATFTVEDVVTNLAPPPGGWNTSNVILSCNGVPCDDQYVQSVTYNTASKRITFTINQGGGEISPEKYLAIRYTAYPQGPLGTTASVFRFSNVATIKYTDPATGSPVTIDCTGLIVSCPLRTPLVLFYRGLPVPFLKEIQ